jgi:hypothetical protein
MGGAKTLSIIIAANIKGLEKAMGKANKSIGSFASNAARFGSMLTFGVTAPIVAMGKASMDTFVNFEDSMAKVMAVTGATTKEFAMLTAEAKRLGSSTRYTAQQFAELQLVLGRKGFDPNQIKSMTGAISKLALATGEDLTLAAEVTSKTIKAFGLHSSDAAKVANTLASAAANSSLQLSTYATAFGHAGAAAKSVGVNVEELSAMMGVLIDNGIKASKAGTGLRKVFIKLNERGISFSDTLEHLATGEMSLTKAQNLVGTTAASQLMILAQNKDVVRELSLEYENNGGRLDEMAGIMEKKSKHKVKMLTSAMETMRTEFGAVISDALLPLIKWLTKVAKWFSNLSTGTKKFIITVGILMASLGPLLLILGGMSALLPILTSGWVILKGAVLTFGKVLLGALLPMIKFIAIGAAIGSVIMYLIGNWKALKERMTDISWWKNMFLDMIITTLKNNPISHLISVINKGMEALGKKKILDPFDVITSFFEDQKDPPKEYAHNFTNFVDGVVSGLAKTKEALQPAIDKFKDFWTVAESGGEGEEEGGLFGSLLTEDAKKWMAWGEALDAEWARQEANIQRWKNTFTAIGQDLAVQFSQNFTDLLMSGENLGEGLKKIFLDLLKQMVAMIIKAAVLAAIMSVIFPGLQQELGGQRFSGTNFLNNLSGQTFADGGRPPLNKLSLVGENGPELFNPGSQSGTIIPNGAIGGSTIPDVRISGDDLLIVFDRASRRKSRR